MERLKTNTAGTWRQRAGGWVLFGALGAPAALSAEPRLEGAPAAPDEVQPGGPGASSGEGAAALQRAIGLELAARGIQLARAHLQLQVREEGGQLFGLLSSKRQGVEVSLPFGALGDPGPLQVRALADEVLRAAQHLRPGYSFTVEPSFALRRSLLEHEERSAVLGIVLGAEAVAGAGLAALTIAYSGDPAMGAVAPWLLSSSAALLAPGVLTLASQHAPREDLARGGLFVGSGAFIAALARDTEFRETRDALWGLAGGQGLSAALTLANAWATPSPDASLAALGRRAHRGPLSDSELATAQRTLMRTKRLLPAWLIASPLIASGGYAIYEGARAANGTATAYLGAGSVALGALLIWLGDPDPDVAADEVVSRVSPQLIVAGSNTLLVGVDGKW